MEDGYFPRGSSVLRRVHGERIVGWVYGQRALLLQALDTRAFAGLWQNTAGKSAPFRRLVHTARTMEVVYFGSRADADAQAARVRRLHERVRWAEEESGGPDRRASEPEFLLWVLACLADSALAVYERFVRRLDGEELERFWQDYLLVGELFGLPREHAPPAYADFRRYLDARLADPDLEVLEDAREICHEIVLEMPAPLHAAPVVRSLNFAALGLLPPRIRDLYGLPWGPAQEAALTAMVTGSRALRPLLPRALRRGSCIADYERIEHAERARLASRAA